jgi:hypothetical protein
MISAVDHAYRLHGEHASVASIHTGKVTRPIDQPLPRGSLDLATVVDDVWINYVIGAK